MIRCSRKKKFQQVFSKNLVKNEEDASFSSLRATRYFVRQQIAPKCRGYGVYFRMLEMFVYVLLFIFSQCFYRLRIHKTFTRKCRDFSSSAASATVSRRLGRLDTVSQHSLANYKDSSFFFPL